MLIKYFHHPIAALHKTFTLVYEFCQKKSQKKDNLRLLQPIFTLSPSIYSDVNPSRNPSIIADMFRAEKIKAWLCKNPNHSIFTEKNTTSLHVLVRLMDVNGIHCIANKLAHIDVIETASRLSALDLILGTPSENSSQAFRLEQERQRHNPLRYTVIEALCQAGALVTTDGFLHTMQHEHDHDIKTLVAYYFYQQRYPKETKALTKELKNSQYANHYIYNFNKKIINQWLLNEKTLLESKQLKQLSHSQVYEIGITLVNTLTQVIYQEHCRMVKDKQMQTTEISSLQD